MPTYGYQCTKCSYIFEKVQKITDNPLTECPECKGKVKRLLYPVGIVFKGAGFHVNDYPKCENSCAQAAHTESKPCAECPCKS
ncbi:MAG TPA: FmdB family transcriptional regulator [Armatimonadetes bacterium]|nr:FmdB family transcriptional regulator [Armatimonadota bacterium]